MQILKSELNEIRFLRGEYLKSLPVFQDYFLELIVEDAFCYSIKRENTVIGYAVKSSENVLIEFYLIDTEISRGVEIFNLVVKELSITRVYCKSFDSLLLNLCTRNNFNYKVIGALYRDSVTSSLNIPAELYHRYADESDMEYLLGQEDETFEPKHKIPFYIKNKSIIMFYNHGIHAGCGFISKIHEDWNYYDLGVWVTPEFREQGIGTQIIDIMKNICSEKGFHPVLGCDIENKASQKAIEKCGFISKYNLLEFFVR